MTEQKPATLYLRISGALYERLVAAAEKGRRSISAQAEMLLERSLKPKAVKP